MVTIFEDLPNEILINILEYIVSPIEIYRCFNNLNCRFNTILRSLHLNLDILMEDKQSLTIIHYFSFYCNRLRVDNVCPSISLENFPHLRSLTIIEPTDRQINSIQSRTLPLIEYLACPARMVSYFSIEYFVWEFYFSIDYI